MYDLNRNLTIRLGKQILREIVLAGLFLHKEGIIHNFINSSSVYLGNEWNVKLGNMQFSHTSESLPIKLTNQMDSFHLCYTATEVINKNETSEFSDVYRCIYWFRFN